MNRTVFPLRMSDGLRQEIRDRAKLENRTQSDLIRDAINLYLITPRPWADKTNLHDKQTTKSGKLRAAASTIQSSQIKKVI